jgi:hypothetical protein
LKEIAELVRPLLHQDITFVDFACGKNDFAPLLGCSFQSFDILPAPQSTTQDWFTVNELPDNIAIGLNPPFGYQGSLAKEFIQHALKFQPIYLFLILPNMRWSPPGYEEILSRELPEDAFYDPDTNKTFKEICTSFKIFKRSNINKKR